MHLSMVGTGYVGLVTGVCLSNSGNNVVCLDVSEEKIRTLREGRCPIYEPGLTELMVRNTAARRLTFRTPGRSPLPWSPRSMQSFMTDQMRNSASRVSAGVRKDFSFSSTSSCRSSP